MADDTAITGTSPDISETPGKYARAASQSGTTLGGSILRHPSAFRPTSRAADERGREGDYAVVERPSDSRRRHRRRDIRNLLLLLLLDARRSIDRKLSALAGPANGRAAFIEERALLLLLLLLPGDVRGAPCATPFPETRRY